MLLVLEYIEGILSVEKGSSCWRARPRHADQTPRYPADENVVRLAWEHFGGNCRIHQVSGQGAWTNQLVLILPTGTRPRPRQAFIHELGTRTSLAPTSDTSLPA
ncbi:MAG: hypothetical protein WBO92_00645 [Candidatus Moraniibacteriota bacterium]